MKHGPISPLDVEDGPHVGQDGHHHHTREDHGLWVQGFGGTAKPYLSSGRPLVSLVSLDLPTLSIV